MYVEESIIVDEYFTWANLYVASCYIVNSNINNPKIFSTATFSFVDTGEKKLGITNNHVLHDYDKHASGELYVDFYVGDFCFNPLELLIDRSVELDLVTFDFDTIDLSLIGEGKMYCSIDTWPPPRIKDNDVVLFSGFPGQYVKKGIPELIFYSVSIMEPVHSIDENRFTLFRDLESSKYEKIKGAIDVGEFNNQGGFSGSLALRAIDKNSLNILVPCGIVYEGSEMFGQITFIRHIDLIKKDGHF